MKTRELSERSEGFKRGYEAGEKDGEKDQFCNPFCYRTQTDEWLGYEEARRDLTKWYF